MDTTQFPEFRYAYGSCISLKDITKNDIVTICDTLNKRNPENLPPDTYKFKPEGVFEGGIKCDYYGHYSWYKTCRLNFWEEDGQLGRWPGFVSPDANKDWKGNLSLILPKGEKISLKFSTFRGYHCTQAKPFTIEELEIWEECMLRGGFMTIRKFRPSIQWS